MKLSYKIILLSILAISLLIFFSPKQSCQKEPSFGMTAPLQPEQNNLDYEDSFVFKEYSITPLANFNIQAKILSKKSYSTFLGDRESDLSPIDLALGWDKMSDDDILKHIRISQSGRWYRWRSKNPPIPLDEIKNNSANMHIIPLNNDILSTINSACKGSTIELEGQLVRVNHKDEWRWKSSLTRTDSGSGACEIVFVHHAKVID